MALYIGIDSGTQSTKAVVLDLDSHRVVAIARAAHAPPSGGDGAAEQDPADWQRALDETLLAVSQQVDRSLVRGLGISGQQHGFVPLDAQGTVIRPAKLWCDTSTAEECALLTRRLGGAQAVIRRVGLPFLPGYTAPKILWLKRREPKSYRRLRHVLLPHDYLNFCLTGHYRTEFGDASGTGLLDIRRRRWSPAAARAIDPALAAWLPELIGPAVPHGVLLPAQAKRYGFGPDVVVSAGGGDNMMGAIGTGNVRSGVVTASFGTSGTIYSRTAKPVVDPAGEIAAFCSSDGGWLPLLCTMNVTGVTEQTRLLLGLDHAALDAAVARSPAGAGGLLLLPYLTGERTPNVPAGTGVLLGLSPATLTADRMARAAMEGVTLGMNYGLGRLRSLGVRPKEIRVTGGGARSPVWRQIMADVFNVPIVAMVDDEGAALGAALQAAWCHSHWQGSRRVPLARMVDAVVAVDAASRCTPQAAAVARYQSLQKVQDRLSLAMRDIFLMR